MKKTIRKKKAVDVQKGHFVSVRLNDGQRAGFYLGSKECERLEGRLENHKKNDANRFFEVDTVLGGVLVLNLGQVRSVVIQRDLSKAAAQSPSEKSLSAYYAGEPIPEHINCAEKEDINLLANMLANTDALGSHFVFVENHLGGRHFFSINEVNYFVLPHYDVTDGNLVDGVPELDAKSGC